MTMNCPLCGARADGLAFCEKCGQRIAPQEPQSPSSPPPPSGSTEAPSAEPAPRPRPGVTLTRAQLAAIAALVLVVVGASVAFAVTRGGNSGPGPTATPAAPATTPAGAGAGLTVSAEPSESGSPTTTDEVDVVDPAREEAANALQAAINLSMAAHDAIAARPDVAGASARLGKCLDLVAATRQMADAANGRSQVLDVLASSDVATTWPEAATFVKLFEDATTTAQQADEAFAAWGRKLQTGCRPRASQDDPSYQMAAQLFDQFSAERHFAAVEWNRLVRQFPELDLVPLPPGGDSL